MIFYTFVGLVVLSVGWLVARSPQLKQLIRGRGADAGRFGNRLDHFFDQQGTGQGWRDDGQGVRGSHIDLPHQGRRDQAP
jgi:hypothetical protein